MENSYAAEIWFMVLWYQNSQSDVAIVLNRISDLQTRECSFVDSSGCHNFYFVTPGQLIQADKNRSKFTFHVFHLQIISVT